MAQVPFRNAVLPSPHRSGVLIGCADEFPASSRRRETFEGLDRSAYLRSPETKFMKPFLNVRRARCGGVHYAVPLSSSARSF
jgi:hypothetical protein